jgi:hypothetical protein
MTIAYTLVAAHGRDTDIFQKGLMKGSGQRSHGRVRNPPANELSRDALRVKTLKL